MQVQSLPSQQKVATVLHLFLHGGEESVMTADHQQSH